MSKSSKTFLIVAILIIIGGIYLFTHTKTVNVSTGPHPTSTASTTAWFDTDYVSTVDWPPQIQIDDTAFSCNEAGTPTDRAGGTKKRNIDHRVYCVTEVTEGAAGSTYTQYAYAFATDGGMQAILTFSLRRPQCLNYDEPRRSECITKQKSFDTDALVDQIVDSLEIT